MPNWPVNAYDLAMEFDFSVQTTIAGFTRTEFAIALRTSSDSAYGQPSGLKTEGTGEM